MVPDLGSNRGESTTSKIGFYPGNVKERLARGMQRTTRLMVGQGCKGKQVVDNTVLSRTVTMCLRSSR